MKRKDYISWDAYFMGLAILSSKRSKDPNTQVGACIVNDENRIVSVGYNGAPNGINDDTDMKWDRDGDFKDTKYAYVCHSELNGILNSKVDLRGCTLYVTLFPCNECAKAIIQSGIKRIVYLSDKYAGTDGNLVAKYMFDKVNIKYEEYKLEGNEIIINV